MTEPKSTGKGFHGTRLYACFNFFSRLPTLAIKDSIFKGYFLQPVPGRYKMLFLVLDLLLFFIFFILIHIMIYTHRMNTSSQSAWMYDTGYSLIPSVAGWVCRAPCSWVCRPVGTIAHYELKIILADYQYLSLTPVD